MMIEDINKTKVIKRYQTLSKRLNTKKTNKKDKIDKNCIHISKIKMYLFGRKQRLSEFFAKIFR